ncbi:hypothetical protein CJ260_00795 [Megasphaera sp. ASD88]|uniref:hypothetical protein n=1 Tax=Megasphaera sp. ASD88 TaxID=2027407 RepID=UPI000BAB8A5E|nr:hypothetical protein [Megasphaera sp. ASD88]PAV40009.1 hypothetical protein CJ260_00795 [Megasphaera sp. ASD88]
MFYLHLQVWQHGELTYEGNISEEFETVEDAITFVNRGNVCKADSSKWDYDFHGNIFELYDIKKDIEYKLQIKRDYSDD